MCALIVWLWICIAGGIGLLLDGDVVTGSVALGAAVVTLIYLAVPTEANRWVIRAALVVGWLGGGLLLWEWTVEDWAVALRIGFAAVGGGALVAYLVYRITGLGPGRGSDRLEGAVPGVGGAEGGEDRAGRR